MAFVGFLLSTLLLNLAGISPEFTGFHQKFTRLINELGHLKKGDIHNSAFPHPQISKQVNK